MESIRQFCRRLKALAKWLVEPVRFWESVGGLVICWIFAWLLGRVAACDLASQIRFFGLFLQLSGLLLVAWGIRDTRKLFGRDSLGKRLRGWLYRFPLVRRNAIAYAQSGDAIIMGGGVRAELIREAPPNATLEERVAAVEKNVEYLRSQIHESDALAAEEVKKVRSEIADRVRTLAGKDQTILNLLEGVSVGGIDLEIVGLVWLMAGIVAATVPDEIAAILRALAT